MSRRVSVVIPLYGGEGYICRALDSVLIQEGVGEILVIDDASDDKGPELVREYHRTHSELLRDKGIELRLLVNRKNLGVAMSRNLGVRQAKYPYIAYLDCDDWWEDGKIRRQLTLMESSGCCLCSTGRRLVKADGSVTDRVIHVKEEIRYRDLLLQNPINCSSVLLRRDIALEYPMSNDEYHEDYITWLRILKKYRKACAIDEPLLCYRLSSSGKSGGKLTSAYKTYKVYRCVGFSVPMSLLCFLAYSANGLKKYTI